MVPVLVLFPAARFSIRHHRQPALGGQGGVDTPLLCGLQPMGLVDRGGEEAAGRVGSPLGRKNRAVAAVTLLASPVCWSGQMQALGMARGRTNDKRNVMVAGKVAAGDLAWSFAFSCPVGSLPDFFGSHISSVV